MPTDVIRRNNVKVSGRGTQPMLFAHGFGCDQQMWRYVAPAFEKRLSRHHVRLCRMGWRQTGRRYDERRYGSLDGYAQDVLDVIHALDLDDIIFVGHSVSSMVGVLAANREPGRFAELVLIGPSPRYINDRPYVGGFERGDIDGLFEMMDKNFIGWANFLAPAIIKNPDRPELGEELTRSFCSTDPLIARRFAQATFYADNRGDLAAVRTPSLILQCADDMVAPEAVGDYLHAQLPQSTLVRMRATGHCPHLSHPGETIALIAEYLNAVRVP